jgi:hypothetical protein
MSPENRWTAGTRLSALSWSTDPRVRVIAAEEENVTEKLDSRRARISALLLTWWFLSCVLWFGLSYLWTFDSWQQLLQVFKYAGMVVGVVAAIFGCMTTFAFVLTRGRLFEGNYRDF